jgi:hypothetical protein
MSDLNKRGFCQKCGVYIPLIKELREENERLRANALDWHKWPDEKPKKYYDNYLVMVAYAGEFSSFMCASYSCDIGVWNGPYIAAKTVTHWAEIPQPEEKL